LFSISFFAFFKKNSNLPVVMSFGFCFALLPLLSLDPESVFGSGQTLIQRIPTDELSCPEEYLAKMASTSTSSKVMPEDEEFDNDVETGEVENDTIVSIMFISIVCGSCCRWHYRCKPGFFFGHVRYFVGH
jgi:hypothetical protein